RGPDHGGSGCDASRVSEGRFFASGDCLRRAGSSGNCAGPTRVAYAGPEHAHGGRCRDADLGY
ncbi:unnamed protein product, partial [Symbiodinium pilosum]